MAKLDGDSAPHTLSFTFLPLNKLAILFTLFSKVDVTKAKRQCIYSIPYWGVRDFEYGWQLEKMHFFFACLTAIIPNWFWMSMERRKALALAFTIDIQNQFGVHFRRQAMGCFWKYNLICRNTVGIYIVAAADKRTIRQSKSCMAVLFWLGAGGCACF